MIDNSTNSLEENLLNMEIKKMDYDFRFLDSAPLVEPHGIIVYKGIPDCFYIALNDVAKAYQLAVAKHPEFPSDDGDAIAVIAEEFAELNAEMLKMVQSHNDGNREQMKEELKHTILTAIRFLESLNGMKI